MSLLRPSSMQVSEVDTYPWTVAAMQTPEGWRFCGVNLLTGDHLKSADSYEKAERYLKALYVEGKRKALQDGEELLDTLVVESTTRH